MDLIEKYREQCYNNNFEFEPLDISTRNDRAELLEHLEISQKRASRTNKISIDDIDHIISDLAKYDYDDGLTTKLVLQKANFNVKEQSKANGCTTRLLFLLKKKNDWVLYAHAKARYNDWDLFNIKDGEQLGYSVFFSIDEKFEALSSGVLDDYAMKIRFNKMIQRFRDARNRN
jgi:hypothetical protein